MIDTSNINIAITMTDEDFIKIADQGDAGPTVSAIEVGNKGWAIYGPNGVYINADGRRIFELAEVHGFLSAWGIRQFVQGKVVLAFQ